MTYKVVLWGPGHIGESALRAVIRHPGLELVAVVVHSEAKEGRDAGDLCGLPPTGVIATRNIDAALAVDADAVAYFASGDFRMLDAVDDIARCLRSGRNVVTTSLVLLTYPPTTDPEMAATLDEACRAGGTSLFTSGIDPGWVNDVLPLTLSGMSERVDRVHMQEIMDYSSIDQPEIMFDLMGFGRPLDPPSLLALPGSLAVAWGPVVQLLAAGLGLHLDEVTDSIEHWLAPERYQVASGPIEAGTVAAMRFRVEGRSAGEARITIEHVTRMGHDAAPDWPRHPSPHGGYRIMLDGMPSFTLDLEIHHDGDHVTGSSAATVMRELNAIPAVVAAPPGLLSTLDPPMVVGPIAGGRWTGMIDPTSVPAQP